MQWSHSTQYTRSVNGVSLPTDWPHRRVTVQGCAVRSPLTCCQVISRPCDWFSRYSKLTDTFWTAVVYVHKAFLLCYHLKNHDLGKSLVCTECVSIVCNFQPKLFVLIVNIYTMPNVQICQE